MSAISTTATEDSFPAASLKQVGDTVAGRIVSFTDYQCTDFKTKAPRFYPSGDPILGVRVVIETNPGVESSRVTLFVQGKYYMRAIAKAVKAAGASDLAEGADLSVSVTGFDGQARLYDAEYAA